MSLLMNDTIRRDLLEAVTSEAESSGDLGTPFIDRVTQAIRDLPAGVDLDAVDMEVDADVYPAGASDEQIVAISIDFHYGNFTPEHWEA